jgi:hypothetical protein
MGGRKVTDFGFIVTIFGAGILVGIGATAIALALAALSKDDDRPNPLAYEDWLREQYHADR